MRKSTKTVSLDDYAQPSFPLYHWMPGAIRPKLERWTGRVLAPVSCETKPAQPGEFKAAVGELEAFQEKLLPTDVLHVPLYEGIVENHGGWPPSKYSDFETNLELVKELAPCVRGILVGNHGPEITYRRIFAHPRANIDHLTEFVKQSGDVLREAGAVPFWGPMDYDLLHDCYDAGGQLRDTINEYGGTSIVFCGFTLVPGAKLHPPNCKDFQGVQVRTVQSRGLQFMKDYLAQGSFWSGVCGQIGLEAGNHEKLAAFGFKVGMAGV